MVDQKKDNWVDVPASDSKWVDVLPDEKEKTSTGPQSSIAGPVIAGAGAALRTAPVIAAGAKALATPDNFGRIATVTGLVKAADDLQKGHPLDALTHAVEGAGVPAVFKVIKSAAEKATKPASTLEYAKAAGETLKPENIIANPEVGGAVDKFANAMGQRIVRILGPNGEVVSTAAAKVPGAVLRAALPVAHALSTVGGVQSGLDLAQMAEPNRKDIGFLGIGLGEPRSEEDKKAHPALLNALYQAAINKLFGK